MLRLVFLRVVSLGPLLLILFSNDKTNLVEHCITFLYCDNLKIITESQSSDIQGVFDNISIWSQVSGLVFHAEKRTRLFGLCNKTMRNSISKAVSPGTYTASWIS